MCTSQWKTDYDGKKHTTYVQLSHSLDDEKNYHPHLVIIITVVSTTIYASLGFIMPIFVLVTIISYGLMTLI